MQEHLFEMLNQKYNPDYEPTAQSGDEAAEPTQDAEEALAADELG